MSIANVTEALHNAGLLSPASFSTEPFASMVMVTQTKPASNSACPLNNMKAVIFTLDELSA